MKIKIKCDDEELILTNEGINNNNSIEIYTKGSNALEPVMVSITELCVAINAFYELRRIDQESDAFYEK